jgi:APA family basic amino acid/polyamine antiporter
MGEITMGSLLTNWFQRLKAMGAFRIKPASQLSAEDTDESGHKLKKELGPIDAIAMGVGCIIGAGIFVMPGVVAAKIAGPAVILSFVFSAIPCVFVIFCLMELAGMITRGGSAYTYSGATMGELVAWIIGFDLLLEYAIGGSAVASGWSAYLQAMLGAVQLDLPAIGLHIHGIHLPAALSTAPADMPWSFVCLGVGGALAGAIAWFNSNHHGHGLLKAVAVGLFGAGAFGLYKVATYVTSIDLPAMLIIAALSVMLMWGVKQTARATLIAVCLKVAVVILFVALGAWHVKTGNFSPFLAFGIGGAFAGSVRAFFAYIGFDAVSTLPEDCKNPKRDVPIGIGGSFIISLVLYMAVAAVMVGCVYYLDLDTAAPMAKVFQVIGADWAVSLISIGAIAGLTSVLIVLLLGQSRILMSMSRDGLMPPVFSKIHPKLQTPTWSIFLLGLGVGLPAGLIPIGELVDLTSIGTLFAFLLVCIGVIVLRRIDPQHERRFKVPLADSKKQLTVAGITYRVCDTIPLLGALSTTGLMVFVSGVTWTRFVVWLVIGLVIYFTYSRHHSKYAWSNDK